MTKQWVKMGLIAGVLGFFSMANADVIALMIPKGKAVLITASAGVVDANGVTKKLNTGVVSDVKKCLLTNKSLWMDDKHKAAQPVTDGPIMTYVSDKRETFYLPGSDTKLRACFAPALN